MATFPIHDDGIIFTGFPRREYTAGSVCASAAKVGSPEGIWMKKETGSCLCVDVDGRWYLVLEHQLFQTFRPYSGPAHPVPTSKSYTLYDGRSLIPIDDDLFRISGTDHLVWKVLSDDTSFLGKVVPFRKRHLSMWVS